MKRRSKKTDKKLAEKLQAYGMGQIACDRCRTVISFANCVPLSMETCPKCGDLFFIPMDIEDWWVTEPIAAGGFGSVYLGLYKEDPLIKSAVKVLHRSDEVAQEDLDNLVREGEIGYSFEAHPHLAQTYAYGYLEDNAFIIMEYLEGVRLNDYIVDKGGTLDVEECMYYAIDMINALEYIYDKGCVYRDMKPGNVIIKTDGLAAIIDYGLCLTLDEAIESWKLPIVGSALFMAPERYLKAGEDLRSDIYSLGMTLYYALMGEPFFSRTEVKTIARAHTMKLRISTQSRMRDANHALVDLIDIMIRRDRDERVRSYEELRGMILGILSDLQGAKTNDPTILARRQYSQNVYGHLA